MPNIRESRVAVTYVVIPCLWLYDLGSLTSRRKRCSLLKMLLVKLSSPGLGLVVVVALSLMSTSLQRNVSCSSSVSRAYASFPTTRTEIQRASMQRNNLFFPSWSVETTEISKLFRSELSRRAVTVLSSVQVDVMTAPACMSLTYVCFVPAASSGASAKTPRNFQAFFLEFRERTTYQNSFRCN